MTSVLELIKYKTSKWTMSADLKVIVMLLNLQGGLTTDFFACGPTNKHYLIKD